MKSGSLQEIKRELKELPHEQLMELCVQLLRYKKENKDYLDFLLFEAHNKTGFADRARSEVSEEINAIDKGANLYYVKKSLRRILRRLVKYCRYLDDKALAAGLHIHFCACLKDSGIPFEQSKHLVSLYLQELKKIDQFIAALHPDLQGDYTREVEAIQLPNYGRT